jgi:hypothetical protein
MVPEVLDVEPQPRLIKKMLPIGLKKRVKIGKFPIEIEQEQAI